MASPEQRIANISDRVAHLVLMGLCQDKSVQHSALAILDALAARESGETEIVQKTRTGLIKSVSTTTQSTQSTQTKKRKADEADLLVCQNCKGIFVESENTDTSCQYHDGELEMDEDAEVWESMDDMDQCTGDDEWMQEEWPEGFRWTCCEALGDTKQMCNVGRHAAVAGSKKRNVSNPVVIDTTGEDKENAVGGGKTA